MDRKTAYLTLAALLVGFSQAAAAEGPTMNPGKWETKTVSTNSFMPKENVKTITECVKENKNPLDSIVEAGKCKVTDKETKGQTVTWQMQCGEGDKAATGKGTFTATGNSGEGVLEMTMFIQDREMTAKNVWTGKRIGDCD
jgi:hypothetical protein